MTIKRNSILDDSGRVLGYLVNGRILAAAGEYENAVRKLRNITTSEQLTLDIPETDSDRDAQDDTGAGQAETPGTIQGARRRAERPRRLLERKI